MSFRPNHRFTRFLPLTLAVALGAGMALASPAARAEGNPVQVASVMNPKHLEPYRASAPVRPVIPPTVVEYQTSHVPGTIVVNSAERRLYLVLENGKAIRYAVGVGRPGFGWTGSHTVSMKQEWPDWRPPAAMLKRRPDLPTHMKGGEDNPLGARALYLGSSIYRIHGSNEPESIGEAVSSGCIRMLNEDVTDLYNRVRVGTRVVVL
ncbi:MAG: L,D-transpeptidase [Beijerinckiaceae bacterium]|nr:L,D-transpeptidase [Beijerinckiaceae bacterium]MCZ8301513.1 L,D-transpeptidase [Beijerinckiaceae bacterium]